MERKSIIAVVAGAAGVLVAATAAGVAVVNAANSGTVTEPTSVVAAQPLTPGAVVEPSPWSGSTESMPLPEIVIPDVSARATQAAPSAPEARLPAESIAQTATVISAAQARSAAADATTGTVLGTQRVQHAGYDAYAVQIERTDGSVVTGYVEVSTGVVYDWVVDRPAPTPQQTYDNDDDDEKYDDDDHDDDHDDDDDDEEYDDDDD